jgi:hypothetical protein
MPNRDDAQALLSASGGPGEIIPGDSTAKPVGLGGGFNWADHADVVSGFRFCATLQLRTPLRVLIRDGELHSSLATEPPPIAAQLWEGAWSVQVRDLPGLPAFKPKIAASDVGAINKEEYLPFLIAVRQQAERDGTAEDRRHMIQTELSRPSWANFVQLHGGEDGVLKQLLPRFVDTLPRLPAGVADQLWDKGLRTPQQISAMPDSGLLSFRGVGPAKVRSLKDACAAAAEKNSPFVDLVVR